MFDSLRRFLADILAERSRQFDESDHRLAAAALLVHVADADGDVQADERNRINTLVETRFGLAPGDAARLVAEATRSDREENGVDRFVHILNRALGEEERETLVGLMWDIVYADGDARETEDSVIWRLAAMLGVPEGRAAALRNARLSGIADDA